MPGWETLYCYRHPDRIALERCEVCHKPLCAYCLYYTEDGQRLCGEHAEQARLNGIAVEEPGAYAEQLVGAQAGIVRKHKRGYEADGELYKGNSTDLIGFIGMLIGLITLGAVCGALACLPMVGFVLSLVAVINAGKAHDPRRTRKFGVIGVLVSGVWVAAMAVCIAAVIVPLSAGGVQSSGPIIVQPGGGNLAATLIAPVFATPTPVGTAVQPAAQTTGLPATPTTPAAPPGAGGR